MAPRVIYVPFGQEPPRGCVFVRVKRQKNGPPEYSVSFELVGIAIEEAIQRAHEEIYVELPPDA